MTKIYSQIFTDEHNINCLENCEIYNTFLLQALKLFILKLIWISGNVFMIYKDCIYYD